jgi:hypothetical protein
MAPTVAACTKRRTKEVSVKIEWCQWVQRAVGRT